MLIYLDNCCFNRPYDDQEHVNVFLETQAKLYIQENILTGRFKLVWSYILQFENDQNPYINHKQEIRKGKNQSSHWVSASENIIEKQRNIRQLVCTLKTLCIVPVRFRLRPIIL